MVVAVLLSCATPPEVEVDGLLSALPPEIRVVERVPGRRPVVVVVEGGSEPIVHQLVEAGATPVSGGAEPDPAVLRFARIVADPASPLAGLRDLALSGTDRPEGWTALRAESLGRIAAAEAALAESGRRVAEEALLAESPVVLPVSVLSAPATTARLRDAGATVAVLRVGDPKDAALWWAGLRAALPAVAPPEAGLPSMAGWVEALRPHAAAVTGWDDREQVRAEIGAMVGPTPPELPPDDPRRAALLGAVERLSAVETLPYDPEPLLRSLSWCDGPMQGTLASYDAWHDALKVAGWVPELDPDLVAAVLAHELTHAHDVRQAAAALGVDPNGWALLLDTLPPGVTRGILLASEDRAYRVEVSVLEALDVTLPTSEEADRVLRDRGATPRERLRASLATLRATRPGTIPWLGAVAELTPVPGG